MVTLFCALVGEKRSAFPVKIDATESVHDLKGAIKRENDYYLKKVDANNLQLFLGKKSDNTWLDSSSDDVKKLKKGETTALIEVLTLKGKEMQGEFGLEEVFEVMPVPKTKEIHVLVVLPTQAIPHDLQLARKQIVQVDEWFVNKLLSILKKKHKLEEEESDQFTRYFKIVGIPPMTHPIKKNTRIMIRDAYVVIFKALMDKVTLRLKGKSFSNIVVTGNSGIGKSCFYLYCIFQLVWGHQEEVIALSSIVLNCNTEYHEYNPSKREFLKLNEREVELLSQKNNVLQLIEGKSSQLTGWNGVSILFASVGLKGLHDYLKVNPSRYIMPVWSLEELQDYNSLLDGGLKLADNDLITRYNKFGGIPRFIFTISESLNDFELRNAIVTFSQIDIISYAENNHVVMDKNYRHLILQMVPSSVDFGPGFYLGFLSKYIAEKVISNVDQANLKRLSKLAISHANDASGVISRARGEIYKILCHRWFNLHKKQENLQLHSLYSEEHLELIIPQDMPIVRFSTLDDILEIPLGLTYFQPASSTFDALDAFILDGNNNRCYGLQMTNNLDHGIKAAVSLSNFLLWLKGFGIPINHFYFAFVLPSNLASHYQRQTKRTEMNEILQNSEPLLLSVQQYVVALDVFVEKA